MSAPIIRPAPPAVYDRNPVKRVHVVVSGSVQGVFFRSTCTGLARARGLGGFVRNLPDGRVEAAFEGIDDDVDALLDWCRVGPDHAHVERVEVSAEEPRGEREFRITR
jgi:acylphosphatase